MKNKRPLFEIPEQLNKVLTDSGLLCSKPLVFAEADMDVSCEFRPHILLLTEKTLIHGKSKNLGMSGGKKQKPDYSEFTFEEYSTENLSDPAIDGFVVGGALRISIDGEQRSVCAFTNTYKGRISRLKEILSTLIKGEEVKEDRLYEDEREEFCPKCGMRYPDRGRKVCPKCMDKRKIFFRLASCFKPFKWHIVAIAVLCVLSAFVNSVWPLLSGSLLYDGVLAKDIDNSIFSALPFKDAAIWLLILVLSMVVVKFLQQLFGIKIGRAHV